MATGIDVFFPLAGPTGGIGHVRCLRSSAALHPERIIDSISKPAEMQPALAALTASRGAAAGSGFGQILVRLFPAGQDFQGESYQLALAIADRLLHAAARPRGRIFATGLLHPDADGAIAPVRPETISLKVRLVDQHIDRPDRAAPGQEDVFIFPAANRPHLTNEAQSAIDAMRRDGVIVHAAAHVQELAFLWRPAP